MRIPKPTVGIVNVQANNNRTLKRIHGQTVKFNRIGFPDLEKP